MTRVASLTCLVLLFIATTVFAKHPFEGKWVNVDETTNNLTRLEIVATNSGWTIQTWGAGGGGEIDQGKVKLTLFGDTVGSTEMKYGYATWDHKFSEVHATLRLEKPWIVTVEDFTIFKDDSGRSNYRVRADFKKMIDKKEDD